MKQRTIEDYLEVLYTLQSKSGSGVRCTDIAKALNIKKATVSETLKKLAAKGYVIAEPYSLIKLAPKGVKEAKKILFKHKTIEYFLKKVLKCDSKAIHREAHKLEHAFSDSTLTKLSRFLGNPKMIESEFHASAD